MSSLQEGNDRILTLKQVKFVGDGKEAAAGSRWQVPVSIATAGSQTVTKVMLDRDEVETVVRLPNVPQAAWVKLNPGVVGFFRVQYPGKCNSHVTQSSSTYL